MVNETAAKLWGWEGQEVLNKRISHQDYDGHGIVYQVVGVVKDFHFKSFHEPFTPLVMTLNPGKGSMIVKVKTDHIKKPAGEGRGTMGALSPSDSISFTFLDDRFRQTY